MKKILVAMLAVVGILFATSCSKEDNEETVLTLSKKSITFKSNGGVQTITVTSNEEWQVDSDTWIEVKKQDKKLVLKVAPNKNFKALIGEVEVKAGELVEVIKVTQEAMAGEATITPENLELESAEGTTKVKVVANTETWKATTDVDWLIVTPDLENQELVVEYSKNNATEDRKGTITITVANTTKTINVVQAGYVFYILPYLDFKNHTREDIANFEKKRRSTFKEENKKNGEIIYETQSPLFKNMIYTFREDAFISAIALASSVQIMKESLAEFKAYLVAQGFKVMENTEGGMIYQNEKLSVRADIRIGKKSAGVIYNFLPRQKDTFPTFKKIPWISELPWGSTEEQIATYESKNEGTYNNKISNMNPEKEPGRLAYDVATKDAETPYRRLYLLGYGKQYKKGLIFKNFQFKKISFAFYKAENGAYKATNEFIKLAKEEGFILSSEDSRGMVEFRNEEKDATMSIIVKKYKGEDAETLDILFQKIKIAANQSAVLAIDSYFEVDFVKNSEKYFFE